MKIRTRRWLMDRFGRVVAALGALTIGLAIVLLAGFIVRETLPLLQPATVQHSRRIAFRATSGNEAGRVGFEADPGRFIAAGIDEYLEKLFLLSGDGSIRVVDVASGDRVERLQIVPAGVEVTTARYEPQTGRIAVGLGDGSAASIAIDFPVSFVGDRRIVGFTAEVREKVQLSPSSSPIIDVDWVESSGREVVGGVTEEGRLLLWIREASRSFFGGGQSVEYVHDLTGHLKARVTAMGLSPDGSTLIVGDERGLLYQWDLTRAGAPTLIATFVANGAEAGGLARDGGGGSWAVTAMRYLIGGRTLVVGDAGGGVAAWSDIPLEGRERLMQPIHIHQGHDGPVVHIAPSQRNRMFATGDQEGVAKFHHSTSEQTFLTLDTGHTGAATLLIAPKSDALLVVGEEGIDLWSVSNPHPEINLKTLFGKVHYEGYPQPAYVWQSTGGSNAFESKLSLTPLAYGTLKGTFYALLFALPLGVLGAVFASQFMSKRLQALIKPVVEIMAGLPSVVLGFLAGLWLAPLLERIFPAVVVMAIMIPMTIILCAWLWRRMPSRFRRRLPGGSEALLLVPAVALVVWASLGVGPILESAAMQGDYRFWLFDVFGLPFDQRNSLVIGIAMGFAVIPIVFSISEDALSSVPQELISGSLALGVTRWQTVLGVVVPVALPGIVSSIMMGIGRAVGETMIVLMATGNTPVIDFSIFNGFRALSANIAVEMPEAPVGGTLYRVLFVAAFLLFVITFALNTMGELIRSRMRKRVERL